MKQICGMNGIYAISMTTKFESENSGAEHAYPAGAHEFIPLVSGVHVVRSFVFCVVFCRSLFVILSLFFWSLCCLSFFYLRLPITPLISSNTLQDLSVVFYTKVDERRILL
jgi:hypothetical protein